MRNCENCNLCCKLPEIPSINKKSYSWCKNCKIGVGCNIYNNKPKKCDEFTCAYLDRDWETKITVFTISH